MINFYEFLLKKDMMLMEMPLKHYGYQFSKPEDRYIGHGDDGNDYFGRSRTQVKSDGEVVQGRYTKKDKTIIAHPRTFRILEEKLKRSKYNFNILFLEERKDNEYLFISTAKQVFEKRPELNDYFSSKGIDIQKSITFLQIGSAGHLMTPWIILHRIGHAISPKDSEYELYSIIMKYFPNKDFDFWSIFKFKSAVNKNIDSAQEGFHELIAEYLWNGKIRSNASDPKVIKMITDIEAYIDLLLESCVGKILTVRG
jgi:hypothetical protein